METVTYNKEQQEAIDAAINFESIVVCGSAGTGKTTIMREIASTLARHPKMPLLPYDTGNERNIVLRKGMPGIVAVSFTHTAVNNISRAIASIIPCFTIHKLLEFSPVVYEIIGDDGIAKNTRIFEPARNKHSPLPEELRTIIIEESGVVSITLFNQLLDALPNPENVQFIFLGDLFQLDPPYDPAILGFTLTSNKFKKIELTHVYRQKLLSPILQFAIDIKERKALGSNHFEDRNVSNEHGTLLIKPWKTSISEFKATEEAAKFLKKEWSAGNYFPEKDIVILPFNKRFGSMELNLLIANFLGKAREAVVHEVIAGFEKKYLAVGDSVLIAKRKGTIINIAHNASYMGKHSPQEASKTLDRFGFNNNKGNLDDASSIEGDVAAHAEIDRLMAASLASNEDRMRSASHCVTVRFGDNDDINSYETILESSGDFSQAKFDFSYCITCYKAQGSEWDTVYMFTHKSHAVMLCNEHFYTAATRAKKKLVVICEKDHLSRAMIKQSIIGQNWREKALHFSRNVSKLGALPLVAAFILK